MNSKPFDEQAKVDTSKAQPVLLFFGLILLLSLPFWILEVFLPVQILPGLPLSALAAFVPAMAALILAARQGGRSGAWDLLRRSLDAGRVKNKAWFLAVLMINPAIAAAAYGIMRLSGKALPSPTLTWGILPMLVMFFLAALGEELGWTGYATGPLQQRLGVAGAGMLLGAVWAAWHVVPLLQAGRAWEWIAWWGLGTLAQRVIMGWLYVHGGKSVFAAALFHAMINLCWQLFPVQGSYYDPRIFGLVTTGLAVAVMVAERLREARLNRR